MAYQAQLFSDLNIGEQFDLIQQPSGGGNKAVAIGSSSWKFKVSSTTYVNISPNHDVNSGNYLSLLGDGKLNIVTVVDDPEVMRIVR